MLEWEYTPPIGPRLIRGFVGLKNAGVTCYMNSVIQQVQLFLIYHYLIRWRKENIPMQIFFPSDT